MRAEETEFEQEWDAVIVGTGMGGATLGHSLAKSGWRVLFVERGESHLLPEEGIRGDYAEMSYSSSAASAESQSDVLRRAGRWTEYLEDRSSRRTKKHIPFIGMGTGGSSALYGAAMERFFPEDFSPGQFYAGAPGVDVPDAWPLTYEELSPYYREAETLYRVRGAPDPLRPDQADAALLDPSA